MIEPLLPELPQREERRGRPWRSNCEVLNGILWILPSGARWKDLPDRFPPYQTCPTPRPAVGYIRALRRVLAARWRKIYNGAANWIYQSVLLTARLSPRKGGQRVGKTKRGKGALLMVAANNASLPVAAYTHSAAPHEVRLVTATLQTSFTGEQPRNLIGDKAYDSDPLDAQLKAEGIEMIAPHKANRKKPATQAGRRLRRSPPDAGRSNA